MSEEQLALWYNDCDYVVATSAADATAQYLKFTGADRCDNFDWQRVADDKQIGMWCDGDGIISEPGDGGNAVVKRPAREWVERYGPGYLGSTEH
jgi:hypothetical protein